MSVNSYKYTEDHEWIKIEGDVVVVGISKYATEELGEIVYVDLPEVGDLFDKTEEFGSIESVKTVSGLYAPLKGNVIAINEDLAETPELVNKSPMEKGWLIRLKIESIEDLQDLLSEEEYKSFLSEL